MMHYHGTLGRVIGFLAVLLLSVAGILVGLSAFNINVLAHPMIQNNLHMLLRPLQIAVGVAGVIGLLHLLGLAFNKCKCDEHDHHRRGPHPK